MDLEQGELRLWVKLVGDEVGDYQKMVHVPEEWERAEKEKNAKRTPVTVSMILVVVLSLLACLVLGVIRWSNKQFNKALFLKALVGIIAISVLGSLNEIPTMVWHFSTSKPWNDQVFQEIGSTALFILRARPRFLPSGAPYMILVFKLGPQGSCSHNTCQK